MVRRFRHGVHARGDGRDLVTLLRQERAEGLADVGFVVADEDAARHRPILAARLEGPPRLAERFRRLFDAPCETFRDTKRKRFFE